MQLYSGQIRAMFHASLAKLIHYVVSFLSPHYEIENMFARCNSRMIISWPQFQPIKLRRLWVTELLRNKFKFHLMFENISTRLRIELNYNYGAQKIWPYSYCLSVGLIIQVIDISGKETCSSHKLIHSQLICIILMEIVQLNY